MEQIRLYLLDAILKVKRTVFTLVPVCNTLYIESINTESLTGPEALSRSIAFVFGSESFAPKATAVQLKVSHEGITLTDNKHRQVTYEGSKHILIIIIYIIYKYIYSYSNENANPPAER